MLEVDYNEQGSPPPKNVCDLSHGIAWESQIQFPGVLLPQPFLKRGLVALSPRVTFLLTGFFLGLKFTP